jgi:hypothetical protein
LRQSLAHFLEDGQASVAGVEDADWGFHRC